MMQGCERGRLCQGRADRELVQVPVYVTTGQAAGQVEYVSLCTHCLRRLYDHNDPSISFAHLLGHVYGRGRPLAPGVALPSCMVAA